MPKLKILVADDNEMFQDLIARFLRGDDGVEVVAVVHNGEEALSAVAQHKPDVVVIDLNMPNAGAVKAPKAIKERLPHTSVYLCSAYPDDALETSVEQLGVDGYISKSELKTGLLEMVKKELGKKQ
jgi:two-component system response regulator DegU